MTLLKKQNVTVLAKADGSLDKAVQRTNDDSVVSKRSAVFHNYFEDPYLRHFVRKLSRRSPLINRGYYLRMLVITDIVETCIRYLQGKKVGTDALTVQVISLGAGYDTLALRLKGKSMYSNVDFYEVDFPSVMKSKSELVRAAPKGSFPSDIIAEPEQDLVKLHGINYHAIGVDLRDTEKNFISCLREASACFSPTHPTVFFAECVMQYMPPVAADELMKEIAWSFPSAIFIAYDQVNPTDSFGDVMQLSLRAKGSPLLGFAATPDGTAMLRRAVASGMQQARFANFHDLSRYYLTGDERKRVEALEPFDEWEEWCEMCEHYGITMALTSHEIGMPAHPSFMLERITENSADQMCALEEVTVRTEKWPTGRFGFEGWGNGQAFAEKLPCGDVLIVSFGGFSATRSHQRTNIVYIHSLNGGDYKVLTADSSVEPPALVFHSVSRIARGEYVVLGGRTNPKDVTTDAYLLQLNLPEQPQKPHVVTMWTKLSPTGNDGSIPEARYRHSATFIHEESEKTEGKQRIFVFGGRGAAGHFLNDAWLATVHAGVIYWKRLALTGDVPPRCCSSAVIPVPASTTVLLSGGLKEGDICEGSVWRINWKTGLCCRVPLTLIPRFSHTLCQVRVNGVARVLVLGGSTCHPREPHQSALLLDAETGALSSVLTLPPECPTWTRHCCVTLGDGVVLVFGGGFTCFSFGTFAAKPLLLFLGDTSGWRATKQEKIATTLLREPLFQSLLLKRPCVEIRPFSKEVFLEIVRRPFKPVVLRNVDMGRSVELWANPAYLKETEGGRTVSVHVVRETHLLDFVKKNFVFQHVLFSELVDHCVSAAAAARINGKQCASNLEMWYLRSVAVNMKSERSNFWKDFPGLGRDFLLPPAVTEYIKPRMHQACLRLSAPPLQLWTHYDTLDNVLCQVVGRKRVVLFPPSQYNNLYMSGSSSAVLNIDAPDLEQFPRFADACRHAIEVILEPGDIIFLPSLWFHHITTLEGSYSISVNVFFERFAHEDYDKKDLYGNKDLPAAVRLRKNIVDYVQQLVSESSGERTSDGNPLTSDFVEFALRQAIQDLEGMADNMAASRHGGKK